MKIYSWNVNGIRAIYKKGAWNEFMNSNPDVVCLQETKAHKEQLPLDLLNYKEYHSYFSSSQVKKGYSGVAIYTKIKPEKVEYGIGIQEFDEEGRIIIAHFPEFVLLNIYFPNGGRGPVRLDYKFRFYDAFLAYINKLKSEGKNVIFCGDVNTAHEEIDLSRPKANEKNTGFLPEERAWIDEVIASGYTDSFRNFNPDKGEQYTWWDMKTRARDRNVGWRIDYFFVANEILSKMKRAFIHSNIIGSDHCPISIELT